MPAIQDDPKTLADSLYKQNIEISGKNKTLSLLSKLYEISILTLAPQDLAAKISQTVQVDLSFELVGILLYDRKKDALLPLAFASSERLYKVQSNFKIFFNSISLPISGSGFLKQIVLTKTMGYSEKLEDLWDSLVATEMFAEISSKGHVRSSIVYPLIIQDEVIGALVLSLNRLYNDLVAYERESISSFINVISVALDKALLYQQLKIANKELKALDLARAEFISIASHQLRTPPATVKWFLSAVLSGDYGKIPKDIQEILVKTQATNNHLISLIEDMLNVSRIERGKMEFLFEPTDVSDLAQKAFEQLQPQAKEKRLEYTFTPPKEPLPKITADKEKLRQVMNNLIDNSIKYTPSGKVEVSLKADKHDLIFAVKDTGKGINAKERDRIFQKFSRGKESIKSSAGLGLGLYVAKIVIEQHGGKIWAESQGEKKGSTFIFSIPITAKKPASSSFDFTAS